MVNISCSNKMVQHCSDVSESQENDRQFLRMYYIPFLVKIMCWHEVKGTGYFLCEVACLQGFLIQQNNITKQTKYDTVCVEVGL